MTFPSLLKGEMHFEKNTPRAAPSWRLLPISKSQEQ